MSTESFLDRAITAAPRHSRSLVVVSNRLPVVLECDPEAGWSAAPGSGGLITALGPALNSRGGRWIGWCGVESETLARDSLDAQTLLDEASAGARYALEGVPLTRREIDEYYCGFSNQTLWPLFHGMSERAVFDSRLYRTYRRVNRKFARKLAESSSAHELIWIHDYQLLTVAEELRTMRSDQPVSLFLHTPFPAPDVLAGLPWHREVLKAIFAHDVVGFQTQRDVERFVACVRRLEPWLELRRDAERTLIITSFGRTTVAAFPIGIDVHGFDTAARTPEVTARADRLRDVFGRRRLVAGVDRLDYTKGIPERLRAFRRLLTDYPELRNEITLFQLVVPSRTGIPAYRRLKSEIEELVGEINGAFAAPGWTPVHYEFRALPFRELVALYRAADVGFVTPLIDGMNLVAKEYCVSHTDEDGVLVLSEFAGAADQLAAGALLVNPHDEEAVAAALKEAVQMPRFERRRRMRALHRAIRSSDVDAWMRHFLNAAHDVAVVKSLPERPRGSRKRHRHVSHAV